MKKNISALILIVGLLVSSCGNTDQAADTAPSTTKDDQILIRVAHKQSSYPYNFVNDEGESDGFEVQIIKEIEKRLPEYKFEYYPTSDEDLLIGLESGKYDVGLKSAWYTEQRAKKFIIPDEKIAASIVGITFRTENQNQIKDLDSFAEFSGKLVPISPQNAQWSVVEEYNSKHSNTPLVLIAAESFHATDAYAWVLEGRYDAYFDTKLAFVRNVVSDDGQYHDKIDQLTFVPYRGIPTYPLIHKSDKNQIFSDQYSKIIKDLQNENIFAELSQKYFDEDVFQYITDSEDS